MPVLKKSALVIKVLVIILLAFPVMVGCTDTTTPSSTASSIELTVCAGVGLTDVITIINNEYMQENKNVKITANFAAAGTLQKQIEQGAPADVFISPGVPQMDALQKGQFILDETRQNLLKNTLVLVVPANSALAITDFKDLTETSVQKIAIGDPQFVPAGNYAQQAFDILGISTQVKPKLVLAGDVRQVLAYVESGNVDAGIIYATDAVTTDKVKVAADAPSEISNKIVYPAAVIRASKNADAAKAYINYLSSAEAKTIFEKHGFSLADE